MNLSFERKPSERPNSTQEEVLEVTKNQDNYGSEVEIVPLNHPSSSPLPAILLPPNSTENIPHVTDRGTLHGIANIPVEVNTRINTKTGMMDGDIVGETKIQNIHTIQAMSMTRSRRGMAQKRCQINESQEY